MKTLIQYLTDQLAAAFVSCGYLSDFGLVRVSDRPDLCQFQCNGAFAGAKLYKKNAYAIAREIATELAQMNLVFKNVTVVGTGFINFDLTDDFILSYTKDLLEDKYLGIPQPENEETILLDYGGPNIAKPLHIGHLRSAIIGESLKRLAQATGRNTISDVHLGDWGLQIGLVIAELQDRYNKDQNKITISSSMLNDIYPYASNKSKKNNEFRLRAQSITSELQKGMPKYISIWKDIMKVSIEDIRANYALLNVDFDLWKGESDSEKYVDELISLLRNEGLLEESFGALVVDISEPNDKNIIPPVIIKKSNDANIYATTDLATIIERQRDFSPTEIWYIVDNRQSMHFTQVFRCAKKAKLVPASTALLHLGFGTMNGSDGKPYKTRDGGVMKLSEFYSYVYNAVFSRVSASTFIEDVDKTEIAKKITVAAIKFADLINHRSKDYIFDLNKFISTEGKTGSFLLYTITRINSILKKFNLDQNSYISETIYTEIERELLIKLALSSEAFIDAYNNKAPNLICENAYQIASVFSSFYDQNHILKELDPDKKAAWVNICKATKTILLKHFDVLGIESVDLM